jgi:hypothetical protein
VLGRFTSETAASTIIAGGVKCWGVLLVREQPLLLLDDSMLGRLIAGGVNAGAGVFYCWRSQMLGRFNINSILLIYCLGAVKWTHSQSIKFSVALTLLLLLLFLLLF